jgi:hypothetical protein
MAIGISFQALRLPKIKVDALASWKIIKDAGVKFFRNCHLYKDYFSSAKLV